MSKLRQIILLTLCLVSPIVVGQSRYSASSKSEKAISSAKGFSSRDVASKPGNALGLHASLYKGMRHYLGFSVDGGWSTFLTNIPEVNMTPGGWAANGKLLYECHIGHFFIQTGVGAGIQRVSTPLKADMLSESTQTFYNGFSDPVAGRAHPMTDPYDGALFTMKHQFGDRTDRSELYYAQFPLNFGYYLVGRGGIGYVMLGAQVNYAFGGKTTVQTTCTSSAVFDIDPNHNYIGVMEEMDNHGFRKDVPITAESGRLPIKLGTTQAGNNVDVLGHLEGGYEFNTYQKIRQYRTSKADKMDCRLRFAAFVDVSLGNINPKGTATLYDLNINENETDPARLAIQQQALYDFHSFKMNHVFNTSIANGDNLWVRSLTVGVRFTVLFSLHAQERCILCDPWKH